MSKRQRVFKRGCEYVVTGPAKQKRSLLFMGSVKVDRKELLLFRPVRRMKKHRS